MGGNNSQSAVDLPPDKNVLLQMSTPKEWFLCDRCSSGRTFLVPCPFPPVPNVLSSLDGPDGQQNIRTGGSGQSSTAAIGLSIWRLSLPRSHLKENEHGEAIVGRPPDNKSPWAAVTRGSTTQGNKRMIGNSLSSVGISFHTLYSWCFQSFSYGQMFSTDERTFVP